MKKELNFRGKKITRNVKHHVLGSDICKINNVWFKVEGNDVTENYIQYDEFLYPFDYPLERDLLKMNLGLYQELK